MKKWFIVLLGIILFPLNVNAQTLPLNSGGDSQFLVVLSDYEVPTWWSVAGGATKKLVIQLGVLNSPVTYKYLVMEICTNGSLYQSYVTNDSKKGSYFEEDVQVFMTSNSCTTQNGYSGKKGYMQLTVGKYKFDNGNALVSSYLNLPNIYTYGVVHSFDDAFLSTEDYVQKLITDKTIIDNQDKTNDKLDKIDDTLNSEDDDFNSKKCGIVCKLKGIGSGIINLPGKLISGLIDGIKGLFVPTNEQLYEIVNDSKELTENFGFIGESMNFFINIFTTLLGLVNAKGCLELPEFTIGSTTLFDSHTFWESRNVCLADNEILSSNIDTIRSFTSIVLVAMFVSFAASKFFNILSKNESKIEYQNEAIDATSKTKWI